MSGQPNLPNNGAAALMENPYVKELFDTLNRCDRDTSGLAALIRHVADMEMFVKSAGEKLDAMKSQLDEIKEISSHPFSGTLQNSTKSLEHRTTALKMYISGLKSNIIDGSKKALSAFAEKGISALSSIASFFRLKEGLTHCSTNIGHAMRDCDDAIKKIEQFSVQHHIAKSALSNMGRVMLDRDVRDITAKTGKLAESIAAPYKSQKAILGKMKASAEKAVSKLEQLDAAQTAKREQHNKSRPSMLKNLAAKKELAEQAKRESPVSNREKAQGLAV